MKATLRAAAVFVLPLFVAAHNPDGPNNAVDEHLLLLGAPQADDAIFNDGSSETTVKWSIVEGGLSSRTVDGGNNLDTSAELVDYFGPDAALGTNDDDLRPSPSSPAVDAGSITVLPTDRFDLDADGDTSEPVPMDRAGNVRVFSGGNAPVADMGAYELGAPVATSTATEIGLGAAYLSVPFPNPSADLMSVQFGVKVTKEVRLSVFDALGREVMLVLDREVGGGIRHRASFSTDELASGVYIIRMHTSEVNLSQSFVIAR